jgi:hypothetical protein
MRRMGLFPLIAIVLLASGLRAETQGTFRGEVIQPPRAERSSGMLYLKGRDGNVLRVVMERAEVVYDAAVGAGKRQQPARKALIPGTEIRVTAMVDDATGEWTASRVDVIEGHSSEFEDDYGPDGTGGPDQVTAPRGPTVDARTI